MAEVHIKRRCTSRQKWGEKGVSAHTKEAVYVEAGRGRGGRAWGGGVLMISHAIDMYQVPGTQQPLT